jgi:hypothetical protein
MESIRSTKQKNSVSGVLFLPGVYKKDCIQLEDIFQDRLLSDPRADDNAKKYDKIPVNFTILSKWPKTTNLSCWYCTRTFKTRPWFEPQSIEPRAIGAVGELMNKTQVKNAINEHGVSIAVKGVFCTCNCVRAYIDTNTRNISERHNKISMLKYIYELFMGKSTPDIQPSPAHTFMVQFGGPLTSEEYQKKINKLNVSYEHELDDNNFANICSVYLKKFIE